MRDVLEETVKEKCEKYLPKTAGQKAVVDVPDIYEAYFARAYFKSFTSDGAGSMVGLVS